jgi:hypothetical protein
MAALNAKGMVLTLDQNSIFEINCGSSKVKISEAPLLVQVSKPVFTSYCE